MKVHRRGDHVDGKRTHAHVDGGRRSTHSRGTRTARVATQGGERKP